MAHDVFVSHSAKDKLVADAIVARLEAESVRCWVAPRDVVPGADWGESIVDAIESSRIMILIFSKNANESPQIKREVERAVDKGVYIIPFRVDNIEPTKSLEYFISTAQWMDAFPPPLERHFETLAKTVNAILAGAPPVPPPSPPPPPPPPATNSVRWIAVAAGLLLVGFAGWYVAGHRRTPPVPGEGIALTTPTLTVAQPTVTIPEKDSEYTAAAKEAQERAKHEAELQAQLAAAQERLKQMQDRTPESQTSTTPSQSGPWLFPDSSSRYLSPNELAGLNADQLWRARNEIYARNGYVFSSPRGIAFARSLGSYYHGVDLDDNRVYNHMNPFEQANVTLIKSIEQR